MSKLQLYITKTFRGTESLLNLNPSADVRQYVADLSSLMEKVSYDATEKNIFYLLSSTDDGVFVTVIRTIPSEPVNHLAAWVYVPGDMVIGGGELERVVKIVTRIVSGHGVNAEGLAELRELFAGEYPVDADRAAYTAGQASGGWAWRVYGGDYAPKLSEFFGDGRFQQCYLPYRGVLLVDADLDYNVALPDLSDIAIGKEAVILPPKPTPEGFVAHVFGRLLDRPLMGTLGAELSVEWRRPGFESVTDTVTVDSERFTPARVVTNESRKLITRDSFSITSRTDHSRLVDCDIQVNGKTIGADGQMFTERELKDAEVCVSHLGFSTFKAHINLASSTRSLIQLKERVKTYCFELPVVSSDLGAPVRFTINAKKPLDDSPIEGYELLDDIQEGETRTNHLGYVRPRFGTPVRTAMFVVGGFVLGLLCGLLVTCKGSSSPKLSPAAQPADTASVVVAATPASAPSSAPVKAAAPTSADAIKYLDENHTWNRDEMERIPALAGLFDDMNNLRLERLVETWGPKLSASKVFEEKVRYHAQESIRKRKGRPLDRTTYNAKTDDKNISVIGYVNYIDK
jgi:hypothetical protein